MADGAARGPLAGVRVLDLATRRAELCGRVLADLGAEVLKLEPPSGCEARRLPPFEGDRADDGEASLYWATVALGKRSAVVDVRSAAGRERLAELAERADVLIESFDPGTLEARSVDGEALCARNPRLIHVSVTPFGRDGPKARWPASELTLEAAGGRLALQGDRDRPPLPIGYPQAAFQAGAQAAADAIVALNERDRSGLGQRLDVSMQAVMIWTLMGASAYPPALGRDPPGAGDDRGGAPSRGARLFPRLAACADGHVAALLGPGVPGTRGVVRVALEERARGGELDPELRDVDWERWGEALRSGEMSDDVARLAVKRALEVLRAKTKRELLPWALDHDLRVGPVHSTRDLLAEPQLAARGFFEEVGGRIHPGVSARLSRTPMRLRPAPRLGEHQDDVRAWLKAEPPPPHPAAGERLGEAFEGVKVADLSWVAAGPTIGKALADHGATVVRVESRERVDLARNLGPFKDGERGLNRSQWMAIYNTSKLSASVNLGVEAGRELARRIIDWSDVVIESYSPGTMQRLGLDYETLARDRSDLVMLSTSLLGQSGPYAAYAGYGQQGSAFAGLHGITGWPDRPPCGPFAPYTDVIAPKYAVAALAAALFERARSGLGQRIDVSQVESSIHFIEPLLLDETVNGRTAGPVGLHSPTACPHGVYATRESERYVALAVETPDEWRALCRVAPLGDLDAPRFDALAARRAARGAIDAALTAWCGGLGCFELEQRLVEAGVPAAVAQRPTDLSADPQLQHRGFHVTLEHAEVGPMTYDGLATRFSAKRRMLHAAAPCLGEHTDVVLRDLLGLTPAEIDAYRAAGALQ